MWKLWKADTMEKNIVATARALITEGSSYKNNDTWKLSQVVENFECSRHDDKWNEFHRSCFRGKWCSHFSVLCFTAVAIVMDMSYTCRQKGRQLLVHLLMSFLASLASLLKKSRAWYLHLYLYRQPRFTNVQYPMVSHKAWVNHFALTSKASPTFPSSLPQVTEPVADKQSKAQNLW